MKKYLMIIVSVLLLIAIAAGCAGNTPADKPEEKTDTDVTTEGMYIVLNGTKVGIGMTYADIKDGIGAETQPEDVILPCDEGDSFRNVMHHYEGATITENRDGKVCEIEVSDLHGNTDNVTLMGKVKVGDKTEDAVAALGEPDNWPTPEDDYSLVYKYDNCFVYVFLDPDTNKATVSEISFMGF